MVDQTEKGRVGLCDGHSEMEWVVHMKESVGKFDRKVASGNFHGPKQVG